ncbi:MAG TPA: filamentous hemagglutinin N-terminal domain-containing protein, partial [Allocoleopsis sp.]
MLVGNIRTSLKIISIIIGSLTLLYLPKTTIANAQPIPDATLPSNSIVNTLQNTSAIRGGTTAGHNLFHSFEQFNIGQGQTVDFISPSAAIRNILVRVTGGNPSEINGTLKTSGFSNPNLFLINPSGIVFGRNARLNVGGSFVATTANAIGFNNHGFFSASNPNDPALLSVNPSAFFFNQILTQPSIISSASERLRGLEVPSGQSLVFLGGNVRLEGGILRVPNGRVELGGLAEAGVVRLNRNSSNPHLSFPRNVARADVSLDNGARIDVQSSGSGSIAINARDIHITHSTVQAGVAARSSASSQTGDITLNAAGRIRITDQSNISNPSGNIRIRDEALFLLDSSQLGSSSRQGNAGDIVIHTRGHIVLNNGLIYAEAFGRELGGNISINAYQDTVSLDAASSISTSAAGSANGGQIDIQARVLSLSGDSEVRAFSAGTGDAGNIRIRATDAVRIMGVDPDRGFSSGLITSSEQENSGRGGDIRVTTNFLSLADGGVLSARTRSSARGGDITINTHTLEAIGGGQIITSAFTSGRAGDITINAQDRVLLSGYDSTYAARSTGDGRAILIDNDGANSGILARVRGSNNANAGNITITTPLLELSDRGRISTETTDGNGGNIRLQDLDLLRMYSESSISASAGRQNQGGDGGNVTIDAQLILV